MVAAEDIGVRWTILLSPAMRSNYDRFTKVFYQEQIRPSKRGSEYLKETWLHFINGSFLMQCSI